MSIADWLRAFRTLHERAKKGELSPEDAETYRAGCDELARALLASQRIATKDGEAPRHALRVARALQVDLETATSKVRATTADLGAGGFSALLAKPPPSGEDVTALLRIPGGDPIEAAVGVVEVKQLPGTARVAFAFKRLSDAQRERIAFLVIDTALSNIAA